MKQFPVSRRDGFRTIREIVRAVDGIDLEIAAGETVEDCAAKLNVAYETARNQLKAIFAKTNTHRQAELVALLTRLLTNGANKAQDEAQIR